MSKIEASTCKIIIERKNGNKEKGTGFFIDKKRILTCSHVVSDDQFKIEISKVGLVDEGITLTARVIDQCPYCDFAILEIIDKYENKNILNLCDSLIISDETIEIFGYPNTDEGQLIGKELKGNVSRYIFDSEESIHDIILNIPSYSRSENYKAFSGSPIINNFGQVLGILKYRDEQHLAAVSVKKAISFLEKNEVEVKPDQLQSFESYNDVFNLFPEDIKTGCEAEANVVIEAKKPTDIVSTLEGDLFYPRQNKTVTEIIEDLRKDKDLNNSLWKGWIKLLTYVKIIKGDSTNINHIEFVLTEVDIKALYGDNISSDTKISVPLKLSFYFTRGKSFFQIARGFLRIEKNQKENICSIFNSSDEHYFLQKFTSSNKKKIIPNISGDASTSFKVEEKINFGVLGLDELSSEIINSENLEEASHNIEKLFIDAIK